MNGATSGSVAIPWTTTLPINQAPATYGSCIVSLPTVDILTISGSPTTVYLGTLQAGARPFTRDQVYPVIVTNSAAQVLGQLTIESTTQGSVPGRVSFKLATGSAFAAGFTLNAAGVEFFIGLINTRQVHRFWFRTISTFGFGTGRGISPIINNRCCSFSIQNEIHLTFQHFESSKH